MTVPLARALKEWETKNGTPSTESKELALYGGVVVDGKRLFIKDLKGIETLREVEKLSLSTNNIDRIAPLNGLGKLKILSIGRNMLKKIERLEDVAATLEELWISYNSIASLDGVSCCTKLRVLYMSNNQIRDWAELDKLATLQSLVDVVFVGNPIYDGMDKAAARLQVIKRLPRCEKVDNEVVTDSHREAAAKL